MAMAAAACAKMRHGGGLDGGGEALSTRPLASLARGGAAALELLPAEPSHSPLDGSPRLDSPLHRLHSKWRAAAIGLARGLTPRLAAAGTGGSYFLLDATGAPVAVFKPKDEEPLAAANPKGRASLASDGGLSGPLGGAAGDAAVVGGCAGEGLRAGLRPGEGAVREVAAYILDRGGFAGVPATALVALRIGAAGGAAASKCGSLQEFVPADGDCEERGPAAFPVREVHKVAVLDLRLGNTDRSAANILVRRRRLPRAGAGSDTAAGAAARDQGAAVGGDEAGSGGSVSGGVDESLELVPIDHGCILPDRFEDLAFEWESWPQSARPFDARTRRYIASLDADADAAALAAHGLELRPACLRVLRVCTALLQAGAAAGLTPRQIAGIAARQAGAAPSVLERMHARAAAAAKAGGGAGAGANGAANGRARGNSSGGRRDASLDLLSSSLSSTSSAASTDGGGGAAPLDEVAYMAEMRRRIAKAVARVAAGGSADEDDDDDGDEEDDGAGAGAGVAVAAAAAAAAAAGAVSDDCADEFAACSL